MEKAVDDASLWRRSTYCADSTCVEIAVAGDEMFMRDSKNKSQPFIRFDQTAWQQFVQGINNGEFRPL